MGTTGDKTSEYSSIEGTTGKMTVFKYIEDLRSLGFSICGEVY